MQLKPFTILLLAILPFLSFGQKELKIIEQEKEMSIGTRNAYVVDIPQAKLKDVTNDFKKYIKKDAKGKVNEDKGRNQHVRCRKQKHFQYALFYFWALCRIIGRRNREHLGGRR
jgi:hypothetical protein